MAAELKALEAALGNPERPVVAVVGGAKVSTASAVIGPTPGIVCSWRGISASFDKAAILAFSASIRPVSWLIWSRSIWQISRARSGMSASGSAMTRSRRGK